MTHLDFSEDSIIMFDLKKHLESMPDLYKRKEKDAKFSEDTWKKLTSLATSVIESFKETGYSKQILRIAVMECA